jgi:hypothetical protein
VLRALALDPACVDAHVALATVLFLNDWDWPAADRSAPAPVLPDER